MHTRIRPITRVLAVVLTAITLFSAPALAAGTVIYDNTRQVSDTLSYTNLASTNAGGRQESYGLTYTPGSDLQAVVSTGSNVYGRSNVNTVISHMESRGYNVVAAVNSDFFSMQTGVPEGLYIADGRLMSSHQGRSAIGFLTDGSAFISNPTLNFTLINHGGAPTASNGGKTTNVLFYNKYRQAGYLYLMDSNYSSTTRTNSAGQEVYFKVLDGQVSVGGQVQLEVADIAASNGAVGIPEGYIVLTADRNCPALSELSKYAVGDRVTLQITSTDSKVSEAVWASGGGDILVSGGQITSSSTWDSTITGRNPRTAIGIKADGSVMLYVADGRSSGYANGLTLQELAQEMIDHGCVSAVNLDGGGSSTFNYRAPGSPSVATLNRPSDGSVRSCATYILLVSKNAGNGQAAYLHYSPLSPVTVLGGSTVAYSDLYTSVIASDNGYKPAAVPASGYTYTAPETLGTAGASTIATASTSASGKVSVTTDGGARGAIGMRLIHTPDSITVKAGGSAITALSVAKGDTVQLGLSAGYGGGEILSSLEAYALAVSGGLGTIDASGRFTAGNASGTGAITVSAGDLTRTIQLIVASVFADTDGHWSEPYISQMKDAGVVGGYETSLGTYFYPDKNINRAEFAVMLTRLLGIDQNQYSLTGSEFADHSSIPEWVRPYAAAMYTFGYIQGKDTGNGVIFDASATISRAETFTILGRMLDTTASENVLSRFSDSHTIPQFARGEMAKLVEAGMLDGYSDGTIRPFGLLTRGEASKTLALSSFGTAQVEDVEPDGGLADEVPDQGDIELPSGEVEPDSEDNGPIEDEDGLPIE